MITCVIAQPIHPVGAKLLRASGINVVQSAGAGLDALKHEIADADAVIVRDHFPASLIDAAPKLCVIANHGTGTDKIDVAHASTLGIPVVFTPTANVRAVAEHALTLMLATAHQSALADAATRRGDWSFKYQQPMISLYGKTLGVAGLGKTGRILCDMAVNALGMSVLVWSPSLPEGEELPKGAKRVSMLADLLQQSDVVSLHRPLRADTYHMLDSTTLPFMKKGAIVINTSRGSLIDEVALVDALRSGHLFGAGIDVFEQEPLPKGSPLSGMPNVVLSPHVAGSSQEALHATATQCAEQIIAVLSNIPPAHMVQSNVWERRRRPREQMQGDDAWMPK